MNFCLCESKEIRKLETIDRKISAKFSGLLCDLFEKNLKDEMLSNGHTVIAVYKKK